MRKLALFAILVSLASTAQAQAVRWFWTAQTINSSEPLPGALYPMLAAPNAKISICSGTPCTLATTYTDATGTTTCPLTAQVTRSGLGVCFSDADSQGNFGVWVSPGTYQFTVTTQTATYGPYYFSAGGGGGSGLNSFTSGNFNPFFTTSLGSDPTHNPALAFTAVSNGNFSFPGNFSGSPGPWTSWTLAAGSNVTLTPSGSTLTIAATGGGGGSTVDFEHNDALLSGAFAANPQIFDVNDTLPAPPTGLLNAYTNCTWQTDSTTGRVSCYVPNGAQMQVQGPISGNSIFLPFTVTSSSPSPGCPGGGALSCIIYTNTSAEITVFADASGFPPSSNSVTYTVPAPLPSTINPANVTAVYAVIWQGGNANVYSTCNGSTISSVGTGVNPYYQLLGSSSSIIAGSNCVFNAGGSGPRYQLYGALNLVGLLVYYSSGTAPPATGIQLEYPLMVDPANGAIGVSSLYPSHLNYTPSASLPSSQTVLGTLWMSNGNTPVDCTSGVGGDYSVPCIPGPTFDTWSAYSPFYGQTSGYLPKITAIGTGGYAYSSASSAVQDTGSAVNVHEPLADVSGSLSVSGGTSNSVSIAEGSTGTPASGQEILIANSTSHTLDLSQNGGAQSPICTVGNTLCSGASGNLTLADQPGRVWTSTTASSTANAFQAGVYYWQSGDTVASINAKCTSACFYILTGNVAVTASATLNSNVYVQAQGGTFTISASQVLTFSHSITSNSSATIFLGSGTVVLAPSQSKPQVGWWGAVGYTGYSAASTGTDSTTAIQACLNAMTTGMTAGTVAGQCMMEGFWYRTTATLTITKAGVGLGGVSGAYYLQSGSAPSGPVSAILLTSASLDVIDVTGPNTTNQIVGNNFTNFLIARSLTPTGTASGLYEQYVMGSVVDHVTSADSIRAFSLNNTPATEGGGIFSHDTALFCEVSPIYNTGTYYGWYLGTSGQSVRMSYATVVNACGTGPTTYGFYWPSGGIDYMLDHSETAGVSYGFDFEGNPTDVHILNSILDHCYTTCVRINSTNAQGNNLEYRGGWMTAVDSGQSYAIDIENGAGVKVTDAEVYAGGTMTSGSYIYLNGTVHSTISRVSIDNQNFSGMWAITVNNSIHNVITDNPISIPHSNGIQFTNSASNNTVQGNNMWLGTGSTGISADSTSNFNTYFDLNDFTGQTNPILDAGTGNQKISGQANGVIPLASAAGIISKQSHMDDGNTTASTITSTETIAAPGFKGTTTTPLFGVQTTSNTDITGRLTLSGGTASYTFANTYTNAPNCVATDNTALNAIETTVTNTTLTVTGTGTDQVTYICVSRQ